MGIILNSGRDVNQHPIMLLNGEQAVRRAQHSSAQLICRADGKNRVGSVIGFNGEW